MMTTSMASMVTAAMSVWRAMTSLMVVRRLMATGIILSVIILGRSGCIAISRNVLDFAGTAEKY
jgi:hypothetical protein